MVTAISGFKASDGQIFDNEIDAYMQELRIVVLQAIGGNEGIANQIISQRAAIYPAMQALVKKEGKDAKQA